MIEWSDFVGAALGGLAAVETAAVVISAPNGIEVNTRRMFAEAGRRVGYKDPFYFSKAFKAFHGASPSEWRLSQK